MLKKISFILSIFFVTISPAHTQICEAGAQFLNLPPGSRAHGMGAAQTAVADDIYALYFNPAGIARFETAGVGAFHYEYIFDIHTTFIGGVKIYLLTSSGSRHKEN